MTVYEFCMLCNDDSQSVSIYDLNDDVENEVFRGTMRDATLSEWHDYEVESFDMDKDSIILNIDSTEDDDF